MDIINICNKTKILEVCGTGALLYALAAAVLVTLKVLSYLPITPACQYAFIISGSVAFSVFALAAFFKITFQVVACVRKQSLVTSNVHSIQIGSPPSVSNNISVPEVDLNDSQKQLLKETREAVEEFKNRHLTETYDQDIKSQGTPSELTRLTDLGLELHGKNEYEVDPVGGNYVGFFHSCASAQNKEGKKIFGGAGLKIHISVDPTAKGNRYNALNALWPILMHPDSGVIQFKVLSLTTKTSLETWFTDFPPRPGGQQGKEITIYLVDQEQIERARRTGVSEEAIQKAEKFVKTPEQIANLIYECLCCLEEADVEGIGYLKNATDFYVHDAVGIRDDRTSEGGTDPKAHVGQHAYGNYAAGQDGNPSWEDPTEEIKICLERLIAANASEEEESD